MDVGVELNAFGDLFARMSPSAVAIMARPGGLILASLGFQMLLNGLENFFA